MQTLLVLVANAGQVVSRDPLLEAAWRDSYQFHGYYRLADIPLRRAFQRSESAARRSLELAPDSTDAHAARG